MPIVFIFIKANPGKINNVLHEVQKIKEVKEAYAVTGDFDLIVKRDVKRVNEASRIILDSIHNLDGVEKTSTSIVLRQPEERQ